MDLPDAVVLRDAEVRKSSGDRDFELVVRDFNVGSNELVTLLGRSGSGKSTLLDVIALIQPPTSFQEFSVAGEEIKVGRNGVLDAAKIRRNIGFVLQHGALLPFLTVEKNIRLAAELAGSRIDETELEELC
jgi:putative ABC transport system ATP-binding protein